MAAHALPALAAGPISHFGLSAQAGCSVIFKADPKSYACANFRTFNLIPKRRSSRLIRIDCVQASDFPASSSASAAADAVALATAGALTLAVAPTGDAVHNDEPYQNVHTSPHFPKPRSKNAFQVGLLSSQPALRRQQPRRPPFGDERRGSLIHDER